MLDLYQVAVFAVPVCERAIRGRTLNKSERPGYLNEPLNGSTFSGEKNISLVLATGKCRPILGRRSALRQDVDRAFVLYACAGCRMQACLGLVELRSFVRGM
jgi:hypothetical protein